MEAERQQDALEDLVNKTIPQAKERLARLSPVSTEALHREITRTILPLMQDLGRRQIETRAQIAEVLDDHAAALESSGSEPSDESQLMPEDAANLKQVLDHHILLLEELANDRVPQAKEQLPALLEAARGCRQLIDDIEVVDAEFEEDEDELARVVEGSKGPGDGLE